MKIVFHVKGEDHSGMYEALSIIFDSTFSEETLDDAPGLHGKLPFELRFRQRVNMKLPVVIHLQERTNGMSAEWRVNTVSVALLALAAGLIVSAVFFLVRGALAGIGSWVLIFLLIYLSMCWQVRRQVFRFMKKNFDCSDA